MADPLMVQKGDKPRIEAWFGTNITSLAVAAVAGALTITVYDTTGYADADGVLIELPSELTAETRVIATSGVSSSTGVLTLTAALRWAHQRGVQVWEPKAPTTVTLTVINPVGQKTVLTGSDLTGNGTGAYYYDLAIDTLGVWRYRWTGTGALVAGGAEGLIQCESTSV